MANLLSTNVTGTLNTTGNTTAAGYTGNANVGGTGAATWHPSGIYCGSTMWQYAAQYKNNTGIYDLSELKLYAGANLSMNNTRNLIVKAHDSNDVMGILGQKSGGGFAFQIYGDGSSYGFLDGAWAGWDIRKAVDGALFMNANDTYYLRTDSTSYLYQLSVNTNVYLDNNYGSSIIGLYSDVRYQGVFAMGDAYKLALNGTSPGSLYGIAWTHSNIGGESKAGLGHQALFMMNGRTYTAIGSGIWTDGTITTTSHGTSANWKTAYDWGNHASAGYQAASTAITTSNIGSQSVSYASSAGNANSLNTTRDTPSDSLQYWQASGLGIDEAPSGDWHNTIRMGHGSPLSYYSNTLAVRMTGTGVGDIYTQTIMNGTRQGWKKHWNDGNHGAGSGLNADLLDGYHGSNYLGKNGNSYYQADTWIQLNGAHGLYAPSYYSAHFYPNGDSSYTQWALNGSKNSYGGIYDVYSRVNGFMYDSEGNGGVYREGNSRWYFYHHVGNNCLAIASSGTSSSYRLYVHGAIYATDDIVAYSDRRKKTDIVTIDNALEKVSQLRGVYYTRLDDETNSRKTGVIAQEINEILPEVVTYAADTDEYGVSYGNIVGVLIEAIKEQQAQIDELKKRLGE